MRVEFSENAKNVHCTTLQAAILLTLDGEGTLSFEQVTPPTPLLCTPCHVRP